MSTVRRPVPESDCSAHPEIRHVVEANAASVPLADCSVEEQAERRYLAGVNPLLNEAFEQQLMGPFVDVLTWTLARVIVALDKPQVTGDILRRIGNYTYRLAEANKAQAEADEARKEGLPPH